MKVLLDERGYVTSYAFVGDLVGGIELPDPGDFSHFEEHFCAYRVRDGTAAFDSEEYDALQTQVAAEEYRTLREKECFSVINRGQLWYDTLTDVQQEELRIWYQAWLEVTETMVMPEKPTWLN